jgi:sugar lactone lactonase YvrE
MGRVVPVAASLLVLLGLQGGADADSSRTRRAPIDRFLLSVPGEGVFLVDLKGQPLWSYRCDPYDACEAGRGRILVTDRRAGRVFIVTREGKTVWQKAGLRGPVNAELLENGNVLVVENDAGRVLEIGQGGELVREFIGHVTPFDARRRPNGNTLVADSGNHRIVEINLQGTIVREACGLKFPNSVFPMSDGRALFTTYTNGTVGEIDANGSLVWERKLGGTLYAVASEGDILWVADGTGGRVIRMTREGTVLQEIRLGRTFLDLAFCR